MSLSTKVLFFFLLAVVASVSKNSCIEIFFNKFSSNIEKFSAVGLEFFNLSQYKSFTTRKQQQLGENKKIRLWLTGNSYFTVENKNFHMVKQNRHLNLNFLFVNTKYSYFFHRFDFLHDDI